MTTTTNRRIDGTIVLLVMMGSLAGAALFGCSRGKSPAPSAGAAAPAGAAASTVPAAPQTPAPAANAPAAPSSGAAQPSGSSAPSGTAAPAQPDLVLLAGATFDGCKAPAPPADPPDGHAATRAQMLTAHTQTASFNAATNDYLACLATAENNFDRQYGRLLGLSGLRQVAALHDRIHNGAVDADTAVADKFNRQLRIYKARGGAT